MGWVSDLLAGLQKLADQSSRSSTNPSSAPVRQAAPQAQPQSASARPTGSNPLAGKKLRYKIGTDNPGRGNADEIVEVGYDWEKPVAGAPSIAYCNLFNEKFSEQSRKERAEYGPYLKTSDTAEDYGEGQIDPRGQGWRRNLTEQFERRKKQGFDRPGRVADHFLGRLKHRDTRPKCHRRS